VPPEPGVPLPDVPEPPDPLRGVDPVEPGVDEPVEPVPTPAQLPETDLIDCTVTIWLEELPIPELVIELDDPELAPAPLWLPAAPALPLPRPLVLPAPLCVPAVPAAPDVPAVLPDALPDVLPPMLLPIEPPATVVISTRLLMLLDRLTFEAPGDAITV